VVDPAPYRAALQVQEGTLHKDEATLAKDMRDLSRYKTLLAANAIARQTEEDQEGTVAQDRAAVETDKGNVAAARINLGWCNIVSPISGRAGVRLVDVGNLVSSSGSTSSVQSTASATNSASATTTGGSGIVIVNQLHPIAVTFTVSEGAFEELNQKTQGFKTPLQVQATSQETNKPLDTGMLSIADNKVDPATGSVELKARFANTGNALWPGQFVNVKLGTETLPHATVVPSTAINRGPNGKYVYIVGPDNKAIMRPVVTAGTEGPLTAIKSGVNPGDMVVLDGQMSLKAGSLVRITQPVPDATASGGAGA
jgi:multidrug efflux system membrane fusion protein